MTYDAVVVGGGTAGLAAATWLARYRRRVLVLDDGRYRNRWVERAHGYLGFGDVDPRELLERGRSELARYPSAELRAGTATDVRREGSDFVLTVGDATVRARRLVLATGVADEFPEVENFFDHYGRTVFHCPTCDGYEARGRRVAVFGWGPHVTGFARHLNHWAAEVTVVTEGRRLEGDEEDRSTLALERIRLVEDDAVALLGRPGDLEGVRLASGGVVRCDLAFFSIAHRPADGLAVQLGCRRTRQGYVVVDQEGQTTVEGVYAAGDLTPGMQLLQVAAGKGAIAGVSCAVSLPGIPD